MTCPEIPGGWSPVGRAPCLEILIGSGADTAKNRSDGVIVFFTVHSPA